MFGKTTNTVHLTSDNNKDLSDTSELQVHLAVLAIRNVQIFVVVPLLTCGIIHLYAADVSQTSVFNSKHSDFF